MKYTHSIILLHGFAMTPSDMEYYVNKINNTFPEFKIKYIIPKAPLRKTTIFKNQKYTSWYDYLTPHCDKEPEINESHLLKTRMKIHKYIQKEINYHNDPTKIFLAGMSQGCCVAIDAGITFNKKIGGIIGFKGHTMSKSIKDFQTIQNIWVCHGENDKTIFYNFAKKSYDVLKKINKSLFLLSQKNINHSTQSGIINQMKSLRKWFDKLNYI